MFEDIGSYHLENIKLFWRRLTKKLNNLYKFIYTIINLKVPAQFKANSIQKITIYFSTPINKYFFGNFQELISITSLVKISTSEVKLQQLPVSHTLAAVKIKQLFLYRIVYFETFLSWNLFDFYFNTMESMKDLQKRVKELEDELEKTRQAVVFRSKISEMSSEVVDSNPYR